MKKICVVTGTRAEYGLLRPIMKGIKADKELKLQIIATGMHLSSEFGLTYKEIEADGFYIDEKVEIQMSSDTAVGITKTMGLALIGFAEAFQRHKPSMVVLLGDRYEMFCVASAAAVAGIPIAHLYGGESTEGLIDEFIRHSISKMSQLHFTSTEVYRKRVIQLGEHPNSVYNVGALGVENVKKTKLLSKNMLEESLNFKLDNDFFVVTFHPVTLEPQTVGEEFQELLEALDEYPSLNIIFTKANADTNGRIINQMIEAYVRRNTQRSVVFASLGTQRYLSLLKYAKAVVGNSSSGITEAPSFNINTINIGDRQKGRVKSKLVIDCSATKDQIVNAIERVLVGVSSNEKNPYEGVDTSKQIVEIIKDSKFLNEEKDLKKSFYDISYDIESKEE